MAELIVGLMASAIAALFAIIARYILRLEQKVQNYEDAMRETLEEYRERDRQEAAWWRERQFEDVQSRDEPPRYRGARR